MYDLASFKYIFVECFIYVLVLLLQEFVSLTLIDLLLVIIGRFTTSYKHKTKY